MSADHGLRILMGELAAVAYLRLFVERRALRELLASRDVTDVLTLATGAMRIEVSAHAGPAAVDAASRNVIEKLALALREPAGAA